jgi:hypothetical protein
LIFRQHFAITLPMPLLMIFIADIDIFIIAIIYAIIFIADILFNIIIFIIYSIISLQGFRFHFQMLNFGLMPLPYAFSQTPAAFQLSSPLHSATIARAFRLIARLFAALRRHTLSPLRRQRFHASAMPAPCHIVAGDFAISSLPRLPH